MSAPVHPVDLMMRVAAGDPEPTDDQTSAARETLLSVIRSEVEPRPAAIGVRRRPARTGPRPLVAGALASALVVLVVLVAVTGVLRPHPVTALGELATVAEQTDPPLPAEGQYIYSAVRQTALTSLPVDATGLEALGDVVYLEHTVVETWTGLDASVRRIVTYGEPDFLDEDAVVAYAAGDLEDIPAAGTTVTEDLSGSPTILDERPWPVEPEGLLREMRVFVTNEGQDLDADAAVVELAADILRAPGADPALRSAVIGALDLMDLEVRDQVGQDRVAVEIEYGDAGGRRRLTLEFDAASNLVHETVVMLDGAPSSGVPPGTVIEDSVYSVPVVVDSLDSP